VRRGSRLAVFWGVLISTAADVACAAIRCNSHRDRRVSIWAVHEMSWPHRRGGRALWSAAIHRRFWVGRGARGWGNALRAEAKRWWITALHTPPPSLGAGHTISWTALRSL